MSSQGDDQKRPPFAELVNTIKEAGADDVFVHTMLDAVPKECMETGVLGETELASRFGKVNKLCRRTALVGDEGGGLLIHLWSYLQSLFIFASVNKVSPDDEIHLRADQNTFELLARAKCFVKSKDLISAVKVLRLLKGEPADIASGWVKDVTRYLEVKQAVDLLTAYAAVVSMRTIY
ncbi:unnamed protein product [Soboliphyme baturini]|uniref:MICOS complex subunit MIC60 n=1 Tax=Soboliphyme baturini TaxID=241478 RepID=A0A183IT68_9BILA|nr:unnamed protein product [Soboliphyme baturini]